MISGRGRLDGAVQKAGKFWVEMGKEGEIFVECFVYVNALPSCAKIWDEAKKVEQ